MSENASSFWFVNRIIISLSLPLFFSLMQRQATPKTVQRQRTHGSVVVAQLAERSLPTPETCGSNCIERKDENKEKMQRMAQFKKTTLSYIANKPVPHLINYYRFDY